MGSRSGADGRAVPRFGDAARSTAAGRLRRRLGISQPAAARLVGVSERAWRSWEAQGGILDGALRVILALVEERQDLCDALREMDRPGRGAPEGA